MALLQGNSSVVDQAGNFQESRVVQTAFDSEVFVSQIGFENFSFVNQAGSFNSATVAQATIDADSRVFQSGSDNIADIVQMGPGGFS
jgi:hypothetical protein